MSPSYEFTLSATKRRIVDQKINSDAIADEPPSDDDGDLMSGNNDGNAWGNDDEVPEITELYWAYDYLITVGFESVFGLLLKVTYIEAFAATSFLMIFMVIIVTFLFVFTKMRFFNIV